MRRSLRWWSKFLAIQMLATLLLLEVAVRVLQPVALRSRIRGDRIVLPVHVTQTWYNQGTKLDPVVTHSKNSLGFRGPDPPSNLDRRLSIITVGGSTTECMMLPDGKTWPDRLAARLAQIAPDLWINNAGFDGHSTFGHLALLSQMVAPMRPKMVIFLVGANDLGIAGWTKYDERMRPVRPHWERLLFTAAEHSELAAIAQNAVLARRAHQQDYGHVDIPLASWPRRVETAGEVERKAAEYRPALPAYRRRLDELVEICRTHGIEPVFVTQPALFGPATDPVTGVDLGSILTGRGGGGLSEWILLEMTNDVTRSVASDRKLLLIDLARTLPKDSRLYYDYWHYTAEGAQKVADIIGEALEPVVRTRARS